MADSTPSRWHRESVNAVRQWETDELLAELHRRRFQRPECLEAFLARIEDLASTNPIMALRLADRGPAYARKVGGVDSEARAWALKGSVERILGNLSIAKECFRRALDVLGDRESAEAAGVKWQFACLLCDEGKIAEGLKVTQEAVTFFQENRRVPGVDSCDRLSLAAALNRKIILLWRSGKKCSEVAQLFLQALRETNENTIKTAAVISKNLAAASAMAWMSGEPGFRADKVLNQIKRARKDLEHLGYDRHTLWGARLQWVEGNGLAYLFGGLSSAAEHHLTTARTSLLNLGARQDVVLLNLDVGYWLILDRKWEDLEDIAQETLRLATSADFNVEKIGALSQWLAAIEGRNLDKDVFGKVYKEVRGLHSLSLPLPGPAADDSSPIGW